MNSETAYHEPWCLAPILPSRGLIFIACEAGFPRKTVVANLSLCITGQARSPLLDLRRGGPVLFCTSNIDPEQSVSRWSGGHPGHKIAESRWHGSSEELLGLIESGPGNLAAVFVDADAAPPEWQSKAGTFDLLHMVAHAFDFPIVVLVDPSRQSSDPIKQLPRQFQRADFLLAVTRVEQDEGGGRLLDTFMLLIAKSHLWTGCAGISFALSSQTGPDGRPAPVFEWREQLRGSPQRLTRDAKAGGFSPAVRDALEAAETLLTSPMNSARLWEILTGAGHPDWAVEKGLTRGTERGRLSKNALRNPDGTFMCWQWRRVSPPWPFPTSGTQSTPLTGPSFNVGGMGGVEGLYPGFGFTQQSSASLKGPANTLNSAAGDTVFSDGTRLTHEIVVECEDRYVSTTANRSMGKAERDQLKRDIARVMLKERGVSPITDKDVAMLASLFPSPREI